MNRPELSSSKQPKAFLMTSSGSVPFSFSPNMVRNMVKLMGPGASTIMPSRYWSVGFLPDTTEKRSPFKTSETHAERLQWLWTWFQQQSEQQCSNNQSFEICEKHEFTKDFRRPTWKYFLHFTYDQICVKTTVQ